MTQHHIVTILFAALLATAGTAVFAADPVQTQEQNQVRTQEQNQVRTEEQNQVRQSSGGGQSNQVRQRSQQHTEHRMGNGPGGGGGMGRGTPRR